MSKTPQARIDTKERISSRYALSRQAPYKGKREKQLQIKAKVAKE
jgi:hypothetical protein